MTIFDYLRDITVTKRGNLPLADYVPYLVNRWLSFLNPTVCECINLNMNAKVFLEDKEMHYKMMIALFPKLKSFPRISYIKKSKETKEEKDLAKINAVAQSLEISVREATSLLFHELACKK